MKKIDYDFFVQYHINDTVIKKKKAKTIMRERMHPKLWDWCYIPSVTLKENIADFAKMLESQNVKKIIDVGCGVKPYGNYFRFSERYVGLDAMRNKNVDVVGENWKMPFEANEFDALISTQVLEHTEKINDAVKEMRRVIRDGGLLLISAPLAFAEHEIPYDFFRFTRYGLRSIFSEFEIVRLIPTCRGYISTIVVLFNNLLHYIPGSVVMLAPVYFLTNITGISLDYLAKFFFNVMQLANPSGMWHDLYDKYYMGLTEGYILILKNKK